MPRRIAVLGATGSVGRQALSVADYRGFRVELLTADRTTGELESLARAYRPAAVAMADETAAADLKLRLADTPIRVYAGEEGICRAVEESEAETVVNAISGKAGLLPTLSVLYSGKRLALANKESLVIAGEIVMRTAKDAGAEILPVDSEHSAIFQSLRSGKRSEISRILLTASGGPFFGWSREALAAVTPEQALAHPTWKMGKKITVDSATLMNKGFEVIEAVHLFGVPAEKIEVVVHRESILHSAVEFADRTVIGEFSLPDMRSCVQYAVDYPDRDPSPLPPLDLAALGKLSFAKPDGEAFPLLPLAVRAISLGGAVPAVLNAADEIAVSAFLDRKLSFPGIAEVVETTVSHFEDLRAEHTLDGVLAADRAARAYAESLVEAR